LSSGRWGSESWNKATTRKVVEITAGWVQENDPADTWHSGSGLSAGHLDIAYNGTAVTVVDQDSRIVQGDVITITITYEK